METDRGVYRNSERIWISMVASTPAAQPLSSFLKASWQRRVLCRDLRNNEVIVHVYGELLPCARGTTGESRIMFVGKFGRQSLVFCDKLEAGVDLLITNGRGQVRQKYALHTLESEDKQRAKRGSTQSEQQEIYIHPLDFISLKKQKTAQDIGLLT